MHLEMVPQAIGLEIASPSTEGLRVTGQEREPLVDTARAYDLCFQHGK